MTHQSFAQGAEQRRAFDAFLEIEAAGWKGRRKTALASKPSTKAFASEAFTDATKPSRIDLLLLAGKPIAASLTAFSGGTGYTLKSAYDEAYASYGPGVLLEVYLMRSFLKERWAQRLDAATDGGHIIDRIWPDRMAVADLAFSFASRGANLRLAGLTTACRLADRTKRTIKRIAEPWRS